MAKAQAIGQVVAARDYLRVIVRQALSGAGHQHARSDIELARITPAEREQEDTMANAVQLLLKLSKRSKEK